MTAATRQPFDRFSRLPKRVAPAVFMAVVLVFLFAPLFIVVLVSLNSARSQVLITGLSLRWYEKALSDPDVEVAIVRTAIAALVTGFVAGFLGLLTAIGLRNAPSRVRRVVRPLILLPMATPSLLLAIGLIIYFNQLGLRRPQLTLTIFGHILIALPFVILTLGAAVERFPFTLLEAARDLGASPVRAFRTITLPLLLPAFIGAVMLAAVISIDEFIIAFFTSGYDTTLPLVIYTRIRSVVDPSLNALATLLLITTSVIAIVATRLTVDRR
jgi:spermidine/putrescine transport system permease protein